METSDLRQDVASKLGSEGEDVDKRMSEINNIAKQATIFRTNAKEGSKLYKEIFDEELKKLLADELGEANDKSQTLTKAERKSQILNKLNTVFEPEQFSNRVAKATESATESINQFVEGAKQGFAKYKEGLEDVAGAMSKTVGNAFKKLEDTLVNFVQTGKFAFKDLARSIIADLTRIAVQQTIMKPLTGWLGGIFPNIFGSAKGNVFAANGIQKFARGGIVDKPTVFPFKNGIGLMGEAGAEAILPLKRGKGGRLGVEGGGGGNTVVNVSVDASGTSVEGDEEQSRQFGQVLAAAIQAEIIDQKRPGGLLSS